MTKEYKRVVDIEVKGSESLDKTTKSISNLNKTASKTKTGLSSASSATKLFAESSGQLQSILGKVTKSQKLLNIAQLASPMGLILGTVGLLVGVFTKLMKTIKGNEEQSNRLSKAMLPLKNIGDLITVAFEKLGDIFLLALENSGKLFGGLKKGFDAVYDNVVQPLLGVFDTIISGYSKVIKFLTGKDPYQFIKDKASEAVDSLKEVTATAQEEADRIAKINEKADEEEKALILLKRKNLVENARIENEIALAREKANDKEKYSAEERLKYSKDAIALSKELYDAKIDEAQKAYDLTVLQNSATKSGEKDLDKEAEQLANINNLKAQQANSTRTLNKVIITTGKEITKNGEAAQKAIDDTLKAQQELVDSWKIVEPLGELDALEAKYQDDLIALGDNLDAKDELTRLYWIKHDKIIADQKAKDDKEAQEKKDKEAQDFKDSQNALSEKYRVANQSKIDAENERYAKELELAKGNNELKEQVEREHQKRLTALEEEEDKKRTAKKKEQVQASVQAVQGALSAVSSLYEADMISQEEMANMSEKQKEKAEKHNKKIFEKEKQVKIASSIISTLQSSLGAYNSLIETPFVGPVIAPIAAASALASGYATVKKIKATKYGTTSATGTSSASTTATSSIPSQSSLINSNSGSRNVNGSTTENKEPTVTKVIVTEHDITKSQNSVKATVSESEF